ncbi:MAG: glycosyltransferase family 2 protein [Candidatus Omnitrophica bacterium]|nr:glycosyltransferase family 2 protein [Candidatus Omnitrophota bacterium]
MEISIILPCLNEESALGRCIDKIREVIKDNSLDAEIIVSDNGSTDRSCEIAADKKATLVHEKVKGYGAAYLRGFDAARGRYLFLADADGTYDFEEIPRFIAELKGGYDFVIGNRFKGNMEKGAMPWANKYIGNPVLAAILRIFFRTTIHDTHCGMRALTRMAADRLNLKTTGMEFASEMIVEALKKRLKIKELPINYHLRSGDSKLQSVADGWRHLRFMLLYSPRFLFLYPGIALFSAGLVTLILLYFDALTVLGRSLQYHPMFPAALLTITGYQLIIFALFAKTYAITHLEDRPVFSKLYKYITIEKAGMAGIAMGAVGVIIYILILIKWVKGGFGQLEEVKNSILALTLVTVGIQTIFSSFMLSILGIRKR